jgi:hypothetical protein
MKYARAVTPPAGDRVVFAASGYAPTEAYGIIGDLHTRRWWARTARSASSASPPRFRLGRDATEPESAMASKGASKTDQAFCPPRSRRRHSLQGLLGEALDCRRRPQPRGQRDRRSPLGRERAPSFRYSVPPLITLCAGRFRRVARRSLISRASRSGRQGFIRYDDAPRVSAAAFR